jgi:hypothetical protein
MGLEQMNGCRGVRIGGRLQQGVDLVSVH